MARAMLAVTVLAYISGFAFASDEQRRDAVHARTSDTRRKPKPEWKRKLEGVLERKVSFEFAETELTEAAKFLATLTKTSIIVDPSAVEEIGEAPITLTVTGMPFSLALTWICRLYDLNFCLRDGAIFITQTENVCSGVDLVIYDVRDMTFLPKDYGPPELGHCGTGPLPARFRPITDDFSCGEPSASSLAELIMSRVYPTKWDAALGTSIEERSGTLVVMQNPEVHKKIREFLQHMRATQTLQVRVDVRLLELPSGLVSEIVESDADKRGVAYLSERALARVERALLPDGEGRLVHATQFLCANGHPPAQ